MPQQLSEETKATQHKNKFKTETESTKVFDDWSQAIPPLVFLMIFLISGTSAAAQTDGRVQNFLSTQSEFPEKYRTRCVLGSINKIRERELQPWLLNSEQKLSASAQKKIAKLKFKKPAIFQAFIDKPDNSALLVLLKSSGSQFTDKMAFTVIKNSLPLQKPMNDLPFDRGLLIEISPQKISVKLAW